jgi:hypothetical protein
MSVDKFGRMSHRTLRRYDHEGKDVEFTEEEVNFKKRRISHILDPTADTDAANKKYVDQFIFNMKGHTDTILGEVNAQKVTSASLTHVHQSLLKEIDETRQLSIETTDSKFLREKHVLLMTLQDLKENNSRSDPPDPIKLSIIKLLQEITLEWISRT